ncbi:MAG: nucleoside hydrolase [Chloroflexi bacterium]|nr:nucleoside hydrolase [Chloroflexota bacterium]
MKLLLDTDIGSDIDDAVCLTYLLANRECDLLGITTVSGQPVERARLASVLCKAAGKPTIPIFPGAEVPLSGLQRQPFAKQASVLSRWPHERHYPDGHAIQFMADTIRSNPGEVTLLAIGPMTNVAMLLKQHPDVATRLGALMLMSGRFGPKPPGEGADQEWNVYCDPVAVDIVYRTEVRSHRSAGLDVTMQVQLPEAEVRRRFGTHPLLAPVLDMAEEWWSGERVMTFHDPLAAACVFEEGLCRFQSGVVTVETGGTTRWRPDPAGPHEVAISVDPHRFFELYIAAFGRYAPSQASSPKARGHPQRS